MLEKLCKKRARTNIKIDRAITNLHFLLFVIKMIAIQIFKIKIKKLKF